ncbi:MAG: hypothetical protein V1867_00720 [Candidatus Falkowbacteria bacterium]
MRDTQYDCLTVDDYLKMRGKDIITCIKETFEKDEIPDQFETWLKDKQNYMNFLDCALCDLENAKRALNFLLIQEYPENSPYVIKRKKDVETIKEWVKEVLRDPQKSRLE